MNTAQLCATNRIALNATFAILDSATLLYTYISRFSVNPNYQQREKIRRSCRHKFYSPTVSHPAFQLRSQTALVRFHGRKCVHTRLSAKDRTQGLTRRNRGLPDRAAITTLGAFRTFTNIPGPGVRTAYFAALGSWPGGALEERRKPSGQRCAYARRCSEGVAAPLGCVIFLQFGDVAVFSLCAQYFLNVRDTGGITTLGVLCMLPKCRTAACQSGSFSVSLYPLFTFAKDPAECCQYPH